MPFASAADGTQLHFTDWGEPGARPVLLVHGFGASQNMWNNQIPGLVDAGLRCITFDRRGHGRSDVPGHGYDLDTLAGDIAAVARHADLRDAVLAGHSLGAAEAVRYLAAHADGRIAGLVLSAPSAPVLRQGPDNPDGIAPETFRMARQAMRDDTGAAIQATTSADFLGPGRAVSALLDNAARRQFVDLPLPVLLATFDTNAAADLRADLAGIDIPALVIQGDADKNNPLELTGRRAAGLIRDSRLVILTGAGHGLYQSEARQYTTEIINFARALPATLRLRARS
jgi:pimeloyl-ACP methyl ester carboxylesterase